MPGYSSPQELLGRNFGIYAPDTGVKVSELKVEHVAQGPGGNCLYFLPPASEFGFSPGASPAVAFPAEFRVRGGEIRSWNLSVLANAAVAIALAGSGRCYAWLSFSPFPRARGLFPVELDSFPLEGASPPFGCRSPRNGKLSTAGKALSSAAKSGSLSIWLGISDWANGNGTNRLVPERLPLKVLAEYAGFVGTAVDMVRGPASSRARRRAGPVDETAEISGLVLGAPGFAEFLNKGMPRIADIFARHGLFRAAFSETEFSAAKKILRRGLPEMPGKDELTRMARKAVELVAHFFRENPFSDPGEPRVVYLLLGKERVFSGPGCRVFVSPDRPGGDIRALIFSEMLFASAMHVLSRSAIPPLRLRYYAQGIKALLLRSSLEDGAARPAEFLGRCSGDKTRAARESAMSVAGYLSADRCELYEGRYHRYFRPAGALPAPTGAELERVAALELREAEKRGGVYAQILS